MGALLILLIGFGWLAFNLNEQDLLDSKSNHTEINEFLSTFPLSHRPLGKIDFTALYGESGQFRILHPIFETRHSPQVSLDPVCGPGEPPHPALVFHSNDLSCQTGEFLGGMQKHAVAQPEIAGDDELKDRALALYLARGTPLSHSFLQTPPYTDGLGHGYAYLLVASGYAPYNQKAWIEDHLSYFKVSELREILDRFQIHDIPFRVISQLNEPEIEGVIRAEPVVLSKSYFLMKDQSRLGFTGLSYWVYEIQDLRNALSGSPYDLRPYTSGELCLQRTGNACWTYSSNRSMAYLYRYSQTALVAIAMLFAVCFVLYLRHLLKKDRRLKRNRLSLQVLSHEFRTPVSSMVLLFDQLAPLQNAWRPDAQDLVIRLSAEVFRLQRIIEVTRNYLQVENDRVVFQKGKIESVNEWIADFVKASNASDAANDKIGCEFLANDQSLETDPFWLKFVVDTLVQNAFAHGRAPVNIRLTQRRQQLEITVEDQGICEFKTLRQMTAPFVKSQRSQGMGLGLNIAKFIVDEWGQQLKFTTSPTAFTLSLHQESAR